MKQLKFILILVGLCFVVFSIKKMTGPKIFSNKETSEQITIITTTNPIPSIPSTKILYASMKSLYQIPAFRRCKKIIVFDGIQSGFESRQNDYEEYKKNISKLTETSPYFFNTELVFCPQWSHLAGAIKQALEHVTTPYLFIHQHDFNLVKKIKLNHLLTSMHTNPNIKYVRLNSYGKNLPSNTTGFHYRYDGDVDNFVEGGSLIPLTRTFGWSDNDHIARTDYYRDFILPNCKFGAMEWFLHPLFKKSLREQGPNCHLLFGTYLYGGLNDGKYIQHTDGREAETVKNKTTSKKMI